MGLELLINYTDMGTNKMYKGLLKYIYIYIKLRLFIKNLNKFSNFKQLFRHMSADMRPVRENMMMLAYNHLSPKLKSVMCCLIALFVFVLPQSVIEAAGEKHAHHFLPP